MNEYDINVPSKKTHILENTLQTFPGYKKNNALKKKQYRKDSSYSSKQVGQLSTRLMVVIGQSDEFWGQLKRRLEGQDGTIKVVFPCRSLKKSIPG